MNILGEKKGSLRTEIREMLKSISQELKSEKSLLVSENLKSLLESLLSKGISYIGGFAPMKSEVFWPFSSALKNTRFCFPFPLSETEMDLENLLTKS